jgi:mRNA interferase MazF
MNSEARQQAAQAAQPSPEKPKERETRSVHGHNPRRGEIWDVNWSPGRGAEQLGVRPALIIQNDRGNTSSTYPLTIVASMTRTEREIPLHVRIAPSPENGLTDYTDIKCESIMTIEKSRLIRRRGFIGADDLSRVDTALKLSLNLLL